MSDNHINESVTHEQEKKVKETVIVVNARERIITTKEITFEDIVVFAYGEYDSNPDVVYTVVCSNKHNSNSFDMLKGDVVKVKEGMIFSVTNTNRS